MAVAVVSRIMALVAQDVARLTGDILNQGTATAGTTTTLTDANNERTPIANSQTVIGGYLFVTGGATGTAIGTAREITSYGTLGVFTWIEAVAIAPNTLTTWIRLSRRPQAILDAINNVTRLWPWKQPVPYESRALVTNNLLQYFGTMEEWDAGASAAPDGWTLGGASAAVAREATTVAQGQYSAALTADAGALATLSRTLLTRNIRNLDNASLVLHGVVAENVVADGVVRVTTTNSVGTAVNTDRTGTYATNRWEELKDISATPISVPNNVISLQVQCRAVAGATVYFDDLMLLGPRLYLYDLPPPIIGLDPLILVETARGSDEYDPASPLVYGENWSVIHQDGQGTSRATLLYLHQGLPSGRHLLLKAYRAPDVVAATANVEPNPEWLALAAAVRLLEGDRPSEERNGRLADLRAQLARIELQPWGDIQRSGRPIIWAERR